MECAGRQREHRVHRARDRWRRRRRRAQFCGHGGQCRAQPHAWRCCQRDRRPGLRARPRLLRPGPGRAERLDGPVGRRQQQPAGDSRRRLHGAGHGHRRRRQLQHLHHGDGVAGHTQGQRAHRHGHGLPGALQPRLRARRDQPGRLLLLQPRRCRHRAARCGRPQRGGQCGARRRPPGPHLRQDRRPAGQRQLHRHAGQPLERLRHRAGRPAGRQPRRHGG